MIIDVRCSRRGKVDLSAVGLLVLMDDNTLNLDFEGLTQ